jgi:hypothetical protein
LEHNMVQKVYLLIRIWMAQAKDKAAVVVGDGRREGTIFMPPMPRQITLFFINLKP